MFFYDSGPKLWQAFPGYFLLMESIESHLNKSTIPLSKLAKIEYQRHSTFYDLVLEITQHHFAYILFSRNKSPKFSLLNEKGINP